MIDVERPLESAANVYINAILNRSTGHKLNIIESMARDYNVNGVILHSDRSCKPYSIGQMDQSSQLTDKLELPSLLLEADHNDPRVFADAQIENRLESFLEII